MAKKYLSVKSKCSFPLPDKSSFRDGKRGQDAILGFEYLEKLPPELGAIARCRIYRLDPPIDMRLIGNKTTDIDIWEGPLTFPAEEYEKYFYHTHGAGAYKVTVEEQGLSGMVCDIWFTLPDRDGYPPKIDDRTLCIDKPGAKDYIDWRARRGDPVSGQTTSETELGDDFMQLGNSQPAASPATALVEGLVEISKTQVEQANRRADQAETAARENTQRSNGDVSSNPISVAANEGIKLMGDVMRETAKNSGSQFDPLAIIKTVVEIMPKPAPPPDQAPMFNSILTIVQESNKAMMQMVMNQNQELKSELAEIRKERNTEVATTNGGPKSFIDEMAEFTQKAELLGFKKDGGGPVVPEDKGAMVKMVIENLPLIQAAIAGIAQIVVPIFRGAAAPNPAPQFQQQPIIDQPTQPTQPPPDSPQAQQLRFLQLIEKPFLAHLLDPELNGFTFALHILTEGTGGSSPTTDGRVQYNAIKKHWGPRPDKTCGLDILIRGYPPIWDRVRGDQPSYMKFLSEFFSYDQEPLEGQQGGKAA